MLQRHTDPHEKPLAVSPSGVSDGDVTLLAALQDQLLSPAVFIGSDTSD